MEREEGEGSGRFPMIFFVLGFMVRWAPANLSKIFPVLLMSPRETQDQSNVDGQRQEGVAEA
jgi:hypothetical protein